MHMLAYHFRGISSNETNPDTCHKGHAARIGDMSGWVRFPYTKLDRVTAYVTDSSV